MESSISSNRLIDTLSDRYIASPVFESMHTIQEAIGTSCVTEKELLGAWAVSQKILKEINEKVRTEGLVGKEVELAGPELKVPNVQTDLGSAALMATIKDVPQFQIDSLSEYQQAHEIRGAFTGFTLDFIKRADDVYQPTLAYQVGFAMHATPHLTMTIHATGPITSSRLTFAEDEQKDISTDLAFSLLDDCGDEYWSSIRLLRDATESHEVLDASRLRYLAHHAEKILNQQHYDTLPRVERKLADMISLSIPKTLKADMIVDYVVQRQDNEQVYHGGKVSLVAPISNVIFLEETHEVNGEQESTGRRVLCLVSDTKDSGMIYIPAHGVSKIRSV